MTVPPFPAGTIENIAQAIGELYSGTELTGILHAAGLREDPGTGQTKWRRIAYAASASQVARGDGQRVVNLLAQAMSPSRTVSRIGAAAAARDRINQSLALHGLRVNDEGRVSRTTAARTDVEAASRAEHLRTILTGRGMHDEVVAYCRPELMREDYYEAVFEAIKGLGDRMRTMAGVDADGHRLVQDVLEGSTPAVRLTPGRTVTERNEQADIANLAKGLFSAFRNPAAHEPRSTWTITEQDALDVLGTLSMIHRRLDAATTT